MSDNLARHFLLRDDVVFLNHGSFGACPRAVFEAYQDWQLELERQPVAFLGARSDRSHARAARCAGGRTRHRGRQHRRPRQRDRGAQHRRPVARPPARRRDRDDRPRVLGAREDLGLCGAPHRGPRCRRQGADAVGLGGRVHRCDCRRIHRRAPACCSSATSRRRRHSSSRSSDRSARRKREASGLSSTARTRPVTSRSTSMPWMSISTPATVTSG